MKLFSVLVLAVSVVTVTVTAHPTEESCEDWFEQQVNGSIKRMDQKIFFECQTSNLEVNFFLYGPKNRNSEKQLINGDVNGLKNSLFNSSYPTRFIIHGWKSNSESAVCHKLRNAFLAVNKYNVICVDWREKSQTNYFEARKCVPHVGKQVAEMIDFLHKDGGMPFETLLVAGHSLGAHISGFAGKNVKNGRIHQITGLDPASCFYKYHNHKDRLHENDAVYVESIHTSRLGFKKPLGKASFYPNGRNVQPSCGRFLKKHICSHSRSYIYYAEAIRKNNFVTKKCNNYKEALKKQCNTASLVRMGDTDNYLNASGVFYVQIKNKPPFGVGEDKKEKMNFIQLSLSPSIS